MGNILQIVIKVEYSIHQLIKRLWPQPSKAKICTEMWIWCHFLSGIHTAMTSPVAKAKNFFLVERGRVSELCNWDLSQSISAEEIGRSKKVILNFPKEHSLKPQTTSCMYPHKRGYIEVESGCCLLSLPVINSWLFNSSNPVQGKTGTFHFQIWKLVSTGPWHLHRVVERRSGATHW